MVKFKQVLQSTKIVRPVVVDNNLFHICLYKQISIKEFDMQMIGRPLISIAPMMDVTNTHFRYFMRLITKQATLYTEMIHYNAILNSQDYHLSYNQIQHPIVIQLGGSNPKLLAQAALIAKKWGYDQFNLNVGCPSPRVQEGSFGACLMKQKQLVAMCMKAIRKAVNANDIDCTVKCRLGVDQFDSYDFLKDFIEEVSIKGQVSHFIIHARKALLKGLSPAQNRNIPPLKYDLVYKLTQDFPNLKFSLNGGIKTLQQANSILSQHPKLNGCMIGRTAYENPYELIQTDQILYGQKEKVPLSRFQILQQYACYVGKVQNQSANFHGFELVKPAINLFHGKIYCAKYRQILSNHKLMKKDGAVQRLRIAAQFMKNAFKQHQLNQLNKQETKLMGQDVQNIDKDNTDFAKDKQRKKQSEPQVKQRKKQGQPKEKKIEQAQQ